MSTHEQGGGEWDFKGLAYACSSFVRVFTHQSKRRALTSRMATVDQEDQTVGNGEYAEADMGSDVKVVDEIELGDGGSK